MPLPRLFSRQLYSVGEFRRGKWQPTLMAPSPADLRRAECAPRQSLGCRYGGVDRWEMVAPSPPLLLAPLRRRAERALRRPPVASAQGLNGEEGVVVGVVAASSCWPSVARGKKARLRRRRGGGEGDAGSATSSGLRRVAVDGTTSMEWRWGCCCCCGTRREGGAGGESIGVRGRGR